MAEVPFLCARLDLPNLQINATGWYEPNPVPVQITFRSESSCEVEWQLSFGGTDRVRELSGTSLVEAELSHEGTESVTSGESTQVTVATLWIQPQDRGSLEFVLRYRVCGQADMITHQATLIIPRALVSPVVFVPGTMGAWPCKGRERQWELDPLLKTYEPFLRHLQDVGYVFGQTLFTLPYDWRKDIRDIANELAVVVDEAVAEHWQPWITKEHGVDIVAHSMGGLVTGAYLVSHGTKKVRRFVSVGTPWLGAPVAYAIYYGNDLGEYEWVERFFLRSVIWRWRRKVKIPSTLTYFQTKVPSIRQLLPARAFGDFLEQDGRPSPYDSPRNEFLDDLHDRLPVALATLGHDNFLCLVGIIEGSTPQRYFVIESQDEHRWEFGKVRSPRVDCHRDVGDRTVPHLSATFGGQFPHESFSDRPEAEGSAVHQRLTTRVQRRVSRFLTGRNDEVPFFYRHENPADFTPFQKWLVLLVKCPIDLMVTTNGRVIQFDEEHRHWTVDVPGAKVIDFGDEDGHYIVLPWSEGVWQVAGKAKAAGSFTIVGLVCDSNGERVFLTTAGIARRTGEIVGQTTFEITRQGRLISYSTGEKGESLGEAAREPSARTTQRNPKIRTRLHGARIVNTNRAFERVGPGNVRRLVVSSLVGGELPPEIDVVITFPRPMAALKGTVEERTVRATAWRIGVAGRSLALFVVKLPPDIRGIVHVRANEHDIRVRHVRTRIE